MEKRKNQKPLLQSVVINDMLMQNAMSIKTNV